MPDLTLAGSQPLPARAGGDAMPANDQLTALDATFLELEIHLILDNHAA